MTRVNALPADFHVKFGAARAATILRMAGAAAERPTRAQPSAVSLSSLAARWIEPDDAPRSVGAQPSWTAPLDIVQA
jgi:hypothetical protein